jgi:hypothetical protein
MKIQMIVRQLPFPQLNAILRKFALTRRPQHSPSRPENPQLKPQPEGLPERALILPFDQSSPSTRAERILRMNVLYSEERREEVPTSSFLPALQKLQVSERHATLTDALSRLGFHVKSKRK